MSAAPASIRTGRAADLPAVVALERAIPEAPHWSEAEYAAIVAGDTSSGALRRRLFIAESGDRLIGFAVGKVIVSADERLAELESVAVDPSSRRAGTGVALCEAVVAWCRSMDVQDLELEVRAGSKAATGLYRKIGFEVVGDRPAYYDDPVEDALLMRLRLETHR